MGMSGQGSENYPLSGKEIRTLARLLIEYDHLLAQNKTLEQMVTYCDSITEADSTAIHSLQEEINIKVQQLNNRNDVIGLTEEQLENTREQVKFERRRKFLYLITTAGALVLLTISLLF